MPGVPWQPQILADRIFRPSYGPAGEPANDRELRLYLEAQTRSLQEAPPTRISGYQGNDQQIYWTPQGMRSFAPGDQPTREELGLSDEPTANS